MTMSKKSNRFSEQARELHLALKKVSEHFGLSVIKEDSDSYGLEMLMQNGTTGVKFEYSPRDQVGWRAIVGQLSSGQFPKHPVRIDRQSILHRFDLRDVAALRIELIPELADKIISLAPLTAGEISHILEKCCTDIFRGDFSLFIHLRARVMSRLPTSTSG
jgi:hypothetical protein